MGPQYNSGYTVVEVMLFLAISAVLFTTILIGTGSTLQSTRFSDSSRSVHAFVQKQYDDILNGLNIRPSQEACNGGVVDPAPPTSQPAGTSNCLLLGKLIIFQANVSNLQTYLIVGSEPASPNYNQSDESLIYAFQPRVAASGLENYSIPWQATLYGSKRTSDNLAVDALALIRSPRSTRIVTYTYKRPAGNYNLYDLLNPADSADANNFNSATNISNFCLRSANDANATSRVMLLGGEGQNALRLSFTNATGDCNGL